MRAHTKLEMDGRTRLRDALATALAAAQEARAPDRILGLLRGAYRTLESTQFVDDDMIRWAEAGLGAWRRWSALNAATDHQLLVVDHTDALARELRTFGSELRIARVDVAPSRSSTLEALATRSPTAVIFDLDANDLSPTVDVLEWLSTEFPRVRRVGCAHSVEAHLWLRERGLYHAILLKPLTKAQLATALPSTDGSDPSHA